MPREYYFEGLEPSGTLADHCYGRRIYIHRNGLIPETVKKVLDFVSVWGGWDKNIDGWLGWELPINRAEAENAFFLARKVLEHERFRRLSNRPWK